MTYQSKRGGAYPVKYLNGAPWNGQVRPYVIPASNATNTFIGDFMTHETSGDSSLTGLASAIVSPASTIHLGVLIGLEPVNGTALGGDFMTTGAVSLDTPIYRAASTRRIAYICDDPNVAYSMEEDLVGTPMTFDDTLGNADIIATAGSTTTGQSAMAIDSSTILLTSTLDLKLLGLIREPGNDFYSAANDASTQVFYKPRWLVRLNRAILANSVAGLS